MKLISIKRIFYLATSTFILPYFDYCSTLLCYFLKEAIDKLAKRTTITLLNQWPNQKVINKLLCDQEINVEVFNLIC
ncbi:hypothetical protein BpHYR1_041785 [Brachionus plicatilis]|uniref:Uncharacterized protein n=1 Tax=Brachionus plicatilis TaxID=10195 RepID=A0A3M7PTH0_BRAPC|nr:hypothetical protein BpHYR1_041785 [Brachionus plicatilis]